ncbi:hypothetical protein RIF29_13596 [Crotalaria pallida]|uniref:non-specific serine/threonine protein kinase n=1 Tax=Crotalaria pallida TaxID=3830 RepID=A0AAN9P252_CROPI
MAPRYYTEEDATEIASSQFSPLTYLLRIPFPHITVGFIGRCGCSCSHFHIYSFAYFLASFSFFIHHQLTHRSLDVENEVKTQKKAIAEGGFSCVYLAHDAVNMSKAYALKHIICNDQESLELVKKEISVMKSLRGHPNVVTLHANAILDMGRTKEAFLVMEFCEKSLVNVLESRGAAYFDEKQVLAIFRDVCNAVFAMHCHSPPVAHRYQC